MSKQDALNAYQDSKYNGMLYEAEGRIGARSYPLGGVMPLLKQIGNAMWRPFKVSGALVFGYGDAAPPPEMPAIPEEFKGSELEKSFLKSWPLNQQVVNAQVEAFSKLLDLDIGGYWKKASVASHADAVDSRVLFPEEGIAMDQSSATSHSFADAVSRGIGRGISSR